MHRIARLKAKSGRKDLFSRKEPSRTTSIMMKTKMKLKMTADSIDERIGRWRLFQTYLI